MNKKGFTLVEILSVIVLISLLLGLGIPGVMKISENMKKRALSTKVKLIEEAGVLWGQDNKTLLQSDNDCITNDEVVYCKKISVRELIEEDYLTYDNKDDSYYTNPIDNSNMLNKYVYVYKKNNRVYSFYSNELSFKLPDYEIVKLNGTNSYFRFKHQDSFDEYSTLYKFYYKIVDDSACKINSDNCWIEMTENKTENFKSDSLVVVRMEFNDDKSYVDTIVNGFKMIISDNIQSDNWHNNDFTINIYSSEKIKYSFNNKLYNINYSLPIDIKEQTKQTTLYIKSGEVEINYIIKLDKEPPKIKDNKINITYIDETYNVELSAEISDDLEISGYKFVEGNNCDIGTYSDFTTNFIETTINVDRDKNYTLCLRDYSEKLTYITKYIPKNDIEPPTIENYKVSYEPSTASATLSATIKDDINLAGYLFTTNATCPSDKNLYTPTSGTIQNISKDMGVIEGNYYLCAIDSKGNNIKSGPIYVANCRIGGDYYFTCNVGESHWYWFGYQGIDYDFFNIYSNNNQNLKIVFNTLDDNYERDLIPRLNNFGDASDRDLWNWGWYECDINQIKIDIKTNGTICYTTNVNKR